MLSICKEYIQEFEEVNMSNDVPWNKRLYNKFMSEAMLTDLQKKIMETRVTKGWTRTKQCQELHISMSTLDREIKKLKLMYDDLQKDFPEDLPPRKLSKYEDYLDNN